MSKNGAPDGGPGVEIDENLHSRQLAVYGREAMKRMATSSVMISGANGLGVEIAKNVILAGVRSVTVHDTATVTLSDLSAQFYLSEQDVGRNRAEACREKLQELNTSVAVHAAAGPLTDDFVKQFQVVVCTTANLVEAKRLNALCHSAGIAFIWAQTRGVFARVFTDFGPSFTVYDVNGEEPHSGIVASVSSGSPAIVTCVEDERLEFQDGELVSFSEVVGMEKLNTHGPFKVKNCKAHSFELDVDTTGWGEYVRGGIVVQVKEPKALAFKTLEKALPDPGEFLLTDFSKLDRAAQLHVGFQALDQFEAEAGRPPRPADAADAAKLQSLAEQVNAALPAGAAKLEAVDGGVLAKLAHCASAEINPMAAMFGGVVGQEVVKAVSGKFHPIFQWLYFDSIESLPDAEQLTAADEYKPMGTRYDPQIMVFGRTMQRRLSALNLFLVGAGALGCEFLKNFACMGVGCQLPGGAEPGKVTVTDDDVIEKSNLSRQFLFRDWDIGSSKSTVAAAAAQKLNPGFQVLPLQNRVSPETENVFDDKFWQGLDLVVNALDNVNARLYVDSRCVYFCKPLLESGTLGPKCNTQMVIPRLTENYGASRDPPEKQAPMCTVHSFPHNIDHCLTWARSEFEGLLEKAPREAASFLSKPADYAKAVRANPDASARQQLESVAEVLLDNRSTTFEECIKWARMRFQDYFHNRIAQLTYTFPEDATTSTGAPFWSAPKRFPRPLNFDAADRSHAAFVQAGAVLRAEVYGIPRPAWASDASKVAAAAAAVDVPAFVPRAGVQIETDPKADRSKPSQTDRTHDDEAIIESLLAKLEAAAQQLGSAFKLGPIQFEKDDDTNFHMDLIAGLANMRARNYSIPEVDKLKAKLIAGRIIPAIATATAVATGMVCLELYKVVLPGKPLEAYRNTFANLALPLFAMAEPIPPKVTKHNELSWSLWDRWTLEGDLTVQQVLDWFSEKGLSAYSISCGPALLYNNIFPKHVERLNKKMSELVVTVAKMELPAARDHFDVVVACEDDAGEDLDVPLVSIKFR
ncbi:E1 ubiquitin-activating protein [Pleodorina starrii]|nr:E1 ubiquitin-activating protein [Pleodorina starrii]GLC74142.1 E1 ubiquitin-activating protein [Pleodorina starrii]